MNLRTGNMSKEFSECTSTHGRLGNVYLTPGAERVTMVQGKRQGPVRVKPFSSPKKKTVQSRRACVGPQGPHSVLDNLKCQFRCILCHRQGC
jgi:hypothetical protein